MINIHLNLCNIHLERKFARSYAKFHGFCAFTTKCVYCMSNNNLSAAILSIILFFETLRIITEFSQF